MERREIASGDIIGFVGEDWVSDCINIATLGLPNRSVSHVGIVSEYKGKLLVYESTSGDRPPCYVKLKLTRGVQAHPLSELLSIPSFREVWHYPLKCPLYYHQRARLEYVLKGYLGRDYDMNGACHSAGVVFSKVCGMIKGEDLSSLFCSEMVAAVLTHVGTLRTPNSSRWSPNKLCRYLVREGVCLPPQRLK
jgi:hypothetical protein